MGEWPPNWDELIRGIGCEMCANSRPDADRYGVRILAGRYSDAYLQRAAVLRGYTVSPRRGGKLPPPPPPEGLDELPAPCVDRGRA